MSEATKDRVIRIPYDPNNREAWLALRKRGLGGSDAAAIVGLNPYSSRLAVYADKLGLVPEKEDTEAMREGRELEDYVARRWEEKTEKKVQRVNAILMNEAYPFALANLDRKVVGERSLLEIKTTSSFNRTDFQNGEIPPTYYTQVMHYLAVSGYERAYLAVLVLNKAFHTFTIERDEQEIAALMEAEKAFWNDHVLAQVPPEADGSEASLAVLDSAGFVDDVALLQGMEGDFEQLERVSAIIKEYEDEKDDIKARILQRMDCKARGQAQGWTVTYLPQERTSFDKGLLMAKWPQAYAACVKTSTSRTFLVKKIKEEKA